MLEPKLLSYAMHQLNIKLNDIQTVLHGIESKTGPLIMSTCIPHYSLGLSALNRIVPGSYWSEHVLCTPASGFNCSGHPTGGVSPQPHPAPGGLACAHLTAHTTTTTKLPGLLGQLLAELLGGEHLSFTPLCGWRTTEGGGTYTAIHLKCFQHTAKSTY